jgi:hypothetical protein
VNLICGHCCLDFLAVEAQFPYQAASRNQDFMTLHSIIFVFIGTVGIGLISAIISWRGLARRRQGILPPAGQATMADVERLVRAGERLAAIRVYREINHVGLAEAKNAVDDLAKTA